ncbi:MAG: hypothetical protein K0R24_38 [Gammaproteobacteria bacterium]|nr:hypothetical protein [Gammaproteobacteria bacterium]
MVISAFIIVIRSLWRSAWDAKKKSSNTNEEKAGFYRDFGVVSTEAGLKGSLSLAFEKMFGPISLDVTC